MNSWQKCYLGLLMTDIVLSGGFWVLRSLLPSPDPTGAQVIGRILILLLALVVVQTILGLPRVILYLAIKTVRRDSLHLTWFEGYNRQAFRLIYSLCPVMALAIGWILGWSFGNNNPLLLGYSVFTATVLGVVFGMLLALDVTGAFKRDQS